MEQELEPLDAWRDQALDQISRFITAQAESSSPSVSSCYSEEDEYSYSFTSDDSDFGPGQRRKRRFSDDERAKPPRGKRPKVPGQAPPAAPPVKPKNPPVIRPPPPMPQPVGAPNIITQLQLLYRFNPHLALRLLEPYFEAYRRSQQLLTPPNHPRAQPAAPSPATVVQLIGPQRPIVSPSIPIVPHSIPPGGAPAIPPASPVARPQVRSRQWRPRSPSERRRVGPRDMSRTLSRHNRVYFGILATNLKLYAPVSF
jgi:hypothetical protein